MASNTVGQFAAELRMSADLLLTQLRAAGVVKSSSADQLFKEEKEQLLHHLWHLHSAVPDSEKKK